MIAVQTADHPALEAEGRPFRCEACVVDPKRKDAEGKPTPRDSIIKARRCEEDRWDFAEKDGRAFPIQIIPGGPTFGFCPAKIFRDDPVSVAIFNTLIAILETGTWPRAGGIEDQDDFWVDMVAQIGPMRRQMEFQERCRQVLGGVKKGGSEPGKAAGGNRGPKPGGR